MSEEEQFQSAQKECCLQIVNINSLKSHSQSPRKRVSQPNVPWKFEKIKNLLPNSISPKKPDTKNISFQTEDMVELSDEEDESDKEQKVSAFTKQYENCQQVYQKKRRMGSNWLGNKEYFASVFIDQRALARSEGFFFKDAPIFRSKKNECFFDSDFQSGNLYATYKVAKNQYDLILQNDINTKGNTQWFYFRVSNIPPKTKIKLNIVNMLKADSLFNYGMLPCAFSTEANKKNGQGWFRTGSHIKYSRNQMKVQGTRRYYHTLTFIISTPYEGDVLKIAQCYPYTFENLQNLMDTVEKKYAKRNFVKRQLIGETFAKKAIQALRITQENPRKKQPKSLIIITARQHPGETPGSIVCEGFIEYVLSQEKEAAYLRKNYEIIVIPMINPDGVFVGNYRTNLCGLDLNRRWDGSKSKQASELQLIKKYLINTVRNREVSFIIDLHGHSRKMFSFFYGNIGSEGPESVRLFPYICSKISSNMIRFEDCTFNFEESKLKTARIQLNLKYRIPNIFTFESSFSGYFGRNKEKIHFTETHYKSLGTILGKGIFMHERFKKNPQNPDVLLVKKLHEDLKNRPQLIKYGEKLGSGSESEPEQCEVGDREYKSLNDSSEYTKQIKEKTKKKLSKKQIMIKQITKPSRQLYVMDIARVNSIFPNDVLALMPSSYGYREKKERITKNFAEAMVQTNEVPFIKIYDICKIQELMEPEVPIKNQSLLEKQNKSNLFRSSVRPRSSSNSYLELASNISPGKRQVRKRHESGIETKIKETKNKRLSAYVQTIITFHPDVSFEENQTDLMLVNPISKNGDKLKKKNQFSTINMEGSSNKCSSQSFKIGLRPVNIETWRMKKKNFQ